MPYEDSRPLIQKARRRVARGKFDVSVDRIEAMNVRMESALQISFKDGIKTLRKDIPKKALDEAFQAKDYKKLSKIIPWQAMQGVADTTVDALKDSFVDAATHSVKGVERQTNKELRWDASNPRTDKYYDARKQQFMRDLKSGTRDNIQSIVQNANATGMNSKQVADQIVGSIGLNGPQAASYARIEAGLRAKGDMTDKQIQDHMDSVNDTMLDARAKMIAVTETRNASAAGQQASWEAAIDQGLIPEDAQKEWVLGWEQACPQICRPMQGKRVPIRETWKLSMPGGKSKEVMTPSASHPNCRCAATLFIDEDS